MTDAELVTLVERCLIEGVPPSVVARVFGLDTELVKQAVKTVRVKQYGTDDLAEYTEQLQWDAVDQARQILSSGSVADKTRFISSVLGRHISVAGRRTPATQREAAEKVLTMLDGMVKAPSLRAEDDEEPSRFVVRSN